MKLLFAEDEYYTRTGLLTTVPWEELGIDQVMTAEDGNQAMELLEARPDLLLTDIRMPFHSGIELAEEARQRDESCEILILSSYSDKEYLKAAISLSAVAYLEKPVRMEQLREALASAVNRKKQTERLRALDRQESASHPEKPEPLSRPVRMAIEYVQVHYPDPTLSMERLGKMVNLSPDYLSCLFREETGKNLKRYITDIRIAEAKRMLRQTNRAVSEIAKKTGYSSNHYFAKTFRRETGMTPREYRDDGEDEQAP